MKHIYQHLWNLLIETVFVGFFFLQAKLNKAYWLIVHFVIWTQLGYIPSVLSLNAKLSQLVVGGSFILTVQTKRHQSSYLSLCRIREWARCSKFSSKWRCSVSSCESTEVAVLMNCNSTWQKSMTWDSTRTWKPSPAAETLFCSNGFPPPWGATTSSTHAGLRAD